jgi:hypothetical protein
MRASEILRKLADVIDAKEGGNAPTAITNRPGQQEVPQGQPTDTQGIESNAQVNVATMVPPLQQKLDLLKSIAGEEACDACGCTPCECETATDELAIMKQNAGIKIVAASELADDTDIEN